MFPIFLYHELRSYIVLESIRYAQPNNNQDFSIGQDELRTFVGIIFFSGFHSFPAKPKRMYWERSDDVEVRSVYKAMSRNRYVEIKRYFHLANNEELDANREKKVRASFNLTNRALNHLELWLPRL